MFNTFNMGVGMVLTVAAEDADKAIDILKANGEDAYRLGVIAKASGVRAGMKRVAVLVSGGGTNLQALLESEAPRREPERQNRPWWLPASLVSMRWNAPQISVWNLLWCAARITPTASV